MASQINASNSGFGGIVSTGDSSGVLQLQTTGTTAVTIDTSQNVGIGTSSPSYKLHVAGGHQFLQSGYNQYYGSTSNFIGGDSGLGGLFFGAGGGSQNYMSFATASSERMRIDSTGNVSITQTPGKYTIDTTGGQTSIANGGTVDYANASGMLVVNNQTNGAVTIWLCGSGNTAAIGSVTAQVGTFTYVSGINGYRWTNNYGSTATFGFFFVRTRPSA